jgi:magnesium transporter
VTSIEPEQNAAEPEEPSREEVQDAWPALSIDERMDAFRLLPRDEAEELFFSLSARDQLALVQAFPTAERRSWVRLLPPDDAADLVQSAREEDRPALMSLLDDRTKKDVAALLAYREDEAGGLMSPRYARVRPDMTADEALTYLRQQVRSHAQLETLNYSYVLDADRKLVGTVSIRELFSAAGDQPVRLIMHTDLVTVPEDLDQEQLGRIFKQQDLVAVPVVDAEGRMKGIVTIDDIVDVVEEEATEDIQKMGGTEALDAPYLSIGLWSMVKKRGVWLLVLFVGEMLTATAMAAFEHDIARAVVLALFVPLIISSGGNSGSQASTLVIRAMAIGEVRLRDWYRVCRRELASGLALGTMLGSLGFVRIAAWGAISDVYGPHYVLIAATVFVSLIGVVLLGTLAGSMLPFLLRTMRLDPASASAPFVATLVDVTGLLIYFAVASAILSGTLL